MSRDHETSNACAKHSLRITAAPVTLPVNATLHNVVEEVVDVVAPPPADYVAGDLPRSRPLPHGETESIRTTLASVALVKKESAERAEADWMGLAFSPYGTASSCGY